MRLGIVGCGLIGQKRAAAAKGHDVVLVAGKGHEDYQEIAGVKLPFSDRVHVEQALKLWPASQAASRTSTGAEA